MRWPEGYDQLYGSGYSRNKVESMSGHIFEDKIQEHGRHGLNRFY
jgi:hypothetical protein